LYIGGGQPTGDQTRRRAHADDCRIGDIDLLAVRHVDLDPNIMTSGSAWRDPHRHRQTRRGWIKVRHLKQVWFVRFDSFVATGLGGRLGDLLHAHSRFPVNPLQPTMLTAGASEFTDGRRKCRASA
jgi:hypothetical protein